MYITRTPNLSKLTFWCSTAILGSYVIWLDLNILNGAIFADSIPRFFRHFQVVDYSIIRTWWLCNLVPNAFFISEGEKGAVNELEALWTQSWFIYMWWLWIMAASQHRCLLSLPFSFPRNFFLSILEWYEVYRLYTI